MLKIQYNIPTALGRDFNRMPDIMDRHLSRGAHRAAEEVAREEKREAPKALSTLVNSIKATRKGPFSFEVSPHVEYADYVAQGTRLGKKRPPIEPIIAWIRVKRISPDHGDARDLAYAIAAGIQRHGVRANPFHKRTMETMGPRVHRIIRGALASGMREARLS